MSSVVGLHVNAEKKRLEEAKLIAESEKTTYVKVNSSGMLPWNVQFDLIRIISFLSSLLFFSFLFIYLFLFVVFVFVLSFASLLSTSKNRCRV